MLRIKKLLTVLVIFVYFVPVSIFLTFYRVFTQELQDFEILGTFLIPIIFMIAVSVLVVINIVGAVVTVVRARLISFRIVMVFKLCLIPFYICNFVCWAIASMVFHIALIIWPIIPFIIAYTYFTMIGTSVYNIAKLFTLHQSKIITTKQFVIHCILQIMFTLDVIDSIYLAIKQKKFNNSNHR